MNVTVISLMHRPIKDSQPHIHPQFYEIPPAKKGDFEIIVLSDGTDHVYQLDGKHIDRIVPATEIAMSIVRSFMTSQFGVGENCAPGLFFIEGEFTKEEISNRFKEKLLFARRNHHNWLKAIIQSADSDWERFHRHQMISEDQREACRLMGEKRAWLIEGVKEDDKDCPACGTRLPNPNVTKCAACQTIIDPRRHAELFEKVLVRT